MPTVIATPKATNANSYITVARGDALAAERLYATAWTSKTQAEKEAAVIWATALLDSMMEFQGNVTEPGTWDGTQQSGMQALRWPRYPVGNRDGYGYYNKDIIPLEIERATFEIALSLLTSDRFSQPSLFGLGIEEAQVGSLRVKINAEMVQDLIPQNVYAMISHLGVLIPQAQLGGTKTHKLKRA